MKIQFPQKFLKLSNLKTRENWGDCLEEMLREMGFEELWEEGGK
jgi:hypothetical protein